jgi:hypothetical protein
MNLLFYETLRHRVGILICGVVLVGRYLSVGEKGAIN